MEVKIIKSLINSKIQNDKKLIKEIVESTVMLNRVLDLSEMHRGKNRELLSKLIRQSRKNPITKQEQYTTEKAIREYLTNVLK